MLNVCVCVCVYVLQEAQKLGQEDIKNLLKQQKLVLLVDLDQTLIHTTNDNIPANLKVSFLCKTK